MSDEPTYTIAMSNGSEITLPHVDVDNITTTRQMIEARSDAIAETMSQVTRDVALYGNARIQMETERHTARRIPFPGDVDTGYIEVTDTPSGVSCVANNTRSTVWLKHGRYMNVNVGIMPGNSETTYYSGSFPIEVVTYEGTVLYRHSDCYLNELRGQSFNEVIIDEELRESTSNPNNNNKGDNDMSLANNNMDHLVDQAKGNRFGDDLNNALLEYDRIMKEVGIKLGDVPAYVFANEHNEIHGNLIDPMKAVQMTTEYVVWKSKDENKKLIHPKLAKYVNTKVAAPTARLNELKNIVYNNKRRLNEALDSVNHYQQSLFTARIKLEEYKPAAYNFTDQMNQIVASGAFTVKKVADTHILLETSPCQLKYKHERSNVDIDLNMGTFYVEVPYDLTRRSIKVKRGMGNYIFEEYWHPHIGSDGEPCWGTAKDAYVEFLAEGNMLDILILLNQLLTHYSDDSPWYGLPKLWDYVKAGYNRVNWNESVKDLPEIVLTPEEIAARASRQVSWFWCYSCEEYSFYEGESECSICNDHEEEYHDDNNCHHGRDDTDSVTRVDGPNHSDGFDRAPGEEYNG